MKFPVGKTLGILLALLIVGESGIGLAHQIQTNKLLLKERSKEAQFLKPLSELRAEKQKFQVLSVKVAKNLYTDQRLFNLYKGFENEFGKHFYSVAINPSYIMDKNSGMKFFLIKIQVKDMKPEDFFAIVQKEVPPLYVESFQTGGGTITAELKGMINTKAKSFVITPDLYNASKYIVCKLEAVTNDKTLVKYLIKKGYYVAKKGDSYYAGRVLVRNLDALTAEATANAYSEKGIIVMVVKVGGK